MRRLYLRADLIEDRSQRAKALAHDSLLGKIWANGHEACDRQMLERQKFLHRVRDGGWRDAIFLGFPAGVDLEQNACVAAKGFGRAVYGFCQGSAVDAVNACRKLHGFAYLIRLQVPDEVNNQTRMLCNNLSIAKFFNSFLNTAFAHMADV